jgi:hypothetical protein
MATLQEIIEIVKNGSREKFLEVFLGKRYIVMS